MKAVVKYGLGKHESEIRDVPIPQIGKDDVLMEVKAAGVCGSDIHFDNGTLVAGLYPPVILGHEFSGVVAKVGENVTAWKPGDRVVSDNTGHVCGTCYACSTANFLSCPERRGLGYGMDGGFAKYVRIPGDVLKVFPKALMRIPDSISFEEAAIMDPACNAYRAVVQEAAIVPGDYLAVVGVGPLGQLCIQVAHAAGAAKIIAIGLSGDGERFKLAAQNGATDIVVSDQGDVVSQVLALTDGEGPAAVIDCAGPGVVIEQARIMVRQGGTVVKVGYDPRPYPYSLDGFVDRGVSLKGHFGYDWIAWRNVFNLVQAGKMDLNVMISHRMSILEYRKAFEMVQKQEANKIILYPVD